MSPLRRQACLLCRPRFPRSEGTVAALFLTAPDISPVCMWRAQSRRIRRVPHLHGPERHRFCLLSVPPRLINYKAGGDTLNTGAKRMRLAAKLIGFLMVGILILLVMDAYLSVKRQSRSIAPTWSETPAYSVTR